MDIYVKYILFPYFLVQNMIISDALILLVSQLETQQLMTPQIGSNILLYSCAHLVVERYEKSSLNGAF